MAFPKTSTLESVFENLRFRMPKTPFMCGRNAKTEKKPPFLKISAYVWTGPNIHKKKLRGKHDRSSGFISYKALVSLYKNTCVYIKLPCFKLFKTLVGRLLCAVKHSYSCFKYYILHNNFKIISVAQGMFAYVSYSSPARFQCQKY